MAIPENNSLRSILIVEDNPGDLFLLEENLRLSRLRFDSIYKATSIAETIRILNEMQEEISVVLLDLSLPDSSGFNSYFQIKDYSSLTPIIVLTGLADMDLALETMANGAQDYLIKGEFDERLLAKSIQYSIERNRIRESLRVSNESYRNLFYNNPMPIFIWDIHSLQILEVNDVAQQEYGYTRDELLSMNMLELRPEDDHERIRIFVKEFIEAGIMKKSGIWLHKRKNGELMVLDISSHKIDYKGTPAILAIHNNITEKVRLEEKLEEERLLKQKEITEATIQVQEKERYDISTELHDNVNQQLTVAMMYIASAQQKYPNEGELLKQSSGFILNAIEEIRKLSQNLVTPLIKHFGLGKAIEGLFDDISVVNHFQLDLDTENFLEDDIRYEFKLSVFRIVQEMMNNIIKHAKATEVKLQLKREKEHIYLSLSDNGIGFRVEQQRKGIGIYNIISRSEVYNGDVNIESAPGKGTAITITFPITADLLV